jgi:hypothetical protein
MSKQPNHPVLSKSIIKTLLYFDIFNYPLTAAEIFSYLQTNHVTKLDVENELNILAERKLVYNLGSYFSIQNKTELENRRNKGNSFAQKSLSIAADKGVFIFRFPFVRAVMISGSLSKGYMDEKSDFDYFIVTSRKRLWIARTLLVIYKRIFLFNSHKYFCVNYFVDEDHLEIEEQNLFTATELITLIPVVDENIYGRLMKSNTWVNSIFPNFRQTTPLVKQQKSSGKRLAENCINIFFGNAWERLFMKLTLHRWRSIYKEKYREKDFEIAFKTKEYVSKNHPNNYQQKIMDLYDDKYRSFVKENKLPWPT